MLHDRLRRQRFLLLGGALGAALIAQRAIAAEPSAVVNAGVIPSDVSAVVPYAQYLGYFQNAGLDVNVAVMSSGPVIANAVVGGSLDIGSMNMGTLAIASSRGLPLKLLAPAAIVAPGVHTDPMLVQPGSPVRSAADLNGKTIGLGALKTLQHAAVLLWLDKNGGDSKSVKFVEISFPEMIGALDQGRYDACVPTDPFTSHALPQHRIIGRVYDAMAPTFLLFGIVSTDAWLAKNASVASRFSAQILRAAIYANAHPRESAAMLVKLTKVDPSVVETMARSEYGTTITSALIQPVIDVCAKYDFLQSPVTPDDLVWRAKK
jgi:NitT/TauT family transport system substrate-binding protein